MSKPTINPDFLPFVEACSAHRISRTVAYELANAGLLDTFTIGRRRYVKVESLRNLPERLAAQRERTGRDNDGTENGSQRRRRTGTGG